MKNHAARSPSIHVTTRKILLFFLLLLTIMLLVRLPFLAATLVGEEGSFAYLVAGVPRSGTLTPDRLPQMMIGLLGDTVALGPFQRTIMPYVLLEFGPGTLLRALDITALPFSWRNGLVRGSYLGLYVFGIAGVLLRSATAAARGNFPPAAVAILAVTAPLAVGASLQPQIDGGLGVLLLGLASLLLIPTAPIPLRESVIRAGCAGVLVGLGRHEWSIAFAAGAIAAVLATFLLVYEWKERRKALFIALAVSMGFSASALFSFFISPGEYIAGFEVQRRVTGSVSPWMLLHRDIFHVAVCATLIGASSVVLLFLIRKNIGEITGITIVLVAASTLFAGSLLTGWPGDGFPRYYAPVLVMAATVLISLLSRNRNEIPNVVAQSVGLICLLVAVASLWSLSQSWQGREAIGSGAGTDLRVLRASYAATAAEWAADPQGTPLRLAPAGLWLYYPTTSFLGADMGEFAGRYLAEHHPDWAPRFRPPNQ